MIGMCWFKCFWNIWNLANWSEFSWKNNNTGVFLTGKYNPFKSKLYLTQHTCTNCTSTTFITVMSMVVYVPNFALWPVMDNTLSFGTNVDPVHKKCRQRMHMLYQLNAHLVSCTIMERCYITFIELTFSFICWYRSVGVQEKGRLKGIVNVCGKIVGRLR